MMTKVPRFALLAVCVLTNACGRSSAEPHHASAPASATPAPEPEAARPAATAAALEKVECQNMETHFEAGTGQLAIFPPGDTSEHYDFQYQRGELALVVKRVDGYAGDFKHSIEYRYDFTAGSTARCTKKQAKGSEADVAAQLPLAASEPDDCRSAPRVLALSKALQQGPRSEALTKLACTL